jgi:hypothetical protein
MWLPHTRHRLASSTGRSLGQRKIPSAIGTVVIVDPLVSWSEGERSDPDFREDIPAASPAFRGPVAGFGVAQRAICNVRPPNGPSEARAAGATDR